ncbi:MAG TPA: MMPL family transporter [Polyangiaceae bacterium]|nr:MMPL family transporter [Polyangiaceae bacterium]
MSERELPRVLRELARLQAAAPWRFIICAVLSLVPAGWAASRLGFKSDFAELLPDNKDSVIEMRRVSARLPGASTLSLVAQIDDGSKRQALRTFVDRLVPELLALGPEWVGSVDYGVKETRAFFEKNQILYAEVDELRRVRDQVVERYDYEVAKAQGTLLESEPGEVPPPITRESIEKTLSERKAQAAAQADAYPGGYYESQDGTYIAVLIRTPVSGRAAVDELRRRVEGVVRKLEPKRIDPSMHVDYTGDVITSREEYDAIVRDLGEVGASGVAGVLLSVLLFFWRVRTVLTMGATLLVGLGWTFGLTYWTIGYLNSSTGFLVSIIAGNGINYGIMYMARYVEARRDEALSVEDAVMVAHRDSWIPTLASAATAALAYGSLMVTDFRGFKHFGIIGAYGMLLCWLVTYLFMPPIFAASEHVWPAFKRASGDNRARARGYYGVLFSKLATAAPRGTALVGLVLGLASLGLGVRYFLSDPMEYNMKKVRTDDPPNESGARALSHRVDAVVGRLGQEGLAIMTDRLDQVPLLTTELEKRRADAPPDRKPFEKVVSIYSLLPGQQAEKLQLAEEIRDRLQRARKRGFVQDADWAQIETYLPEKRLSPIGIADLPEQVARPFTERDGTRGRIVYIAPKSGESVWDAKYLMRWADSFRHVQLPNGEIIKGSGRAVIYADMIRTIGEDAPKAITLSALGTILVILFAFRGSPLSVGVFLPWLFGISGLVAFLYLKDIKLNFLNFVALPITIGIGAEYAHNMMQRYRQENGQRLAHIITETGGAVTLCSLTTTIGYMALLMSVNRGIRGFGLAAAVGEITCLAAAVLWLPAVLAWAARRRERQAP